MTQTHEAAFETVNPDFPPIELAAADEGRLQVIAECVEVLARG